MSFRDLQQLDLSITFHVDTNFPDNPTRAACYLRAMADAHHISLHIASVGVRELSESSASEVHNLVSGYPAAREVAVVDESQYGEAVWATEGDREVLERIRRILAPGGSESARSNTLRDAIHLQTAIRYAADGIVTCDSDMLRRVDALRPLVNVYTPEQAARIVRRRRRGQRTTNRWRDGRP